MSYKNLASVALREMLGPSRPSTPLPTIDQILESMMWMKERQRESEMELSEISAIMTIEDEEIEMMPQRRQSQLELGSRSEVTSQEEEQEGTRPLRKADIIDELAFRQELERDFVQEGFNGAQIDRVLLDRTYESHMQFGPVDPSDYNYPEEQWFKSQGKGLTYVSPGVLQLGDQETGPYLNSYPGKNPSNGRKNTGVISLLIDGEEINKPSRTCLSEVFGCYQDEDRIQVVNGRKTCWADFVEDDSGLVLMWHVSRTRFGNSRFLEVKEIKRICSRAGKISVFWSHQYFDARVWDSTREFGWDTRNMHPNDARRSPDFFKPFGTCLYRVLKSLAVDLESNKEIHPWMIDGRELDTDNFHKNYRSRHVFVRDFEDGWSHISLERFTGCKQILLGRTAAITWLLTDKFLGKFRDTQFWPAFAQRVCYTLAVNHELQKTFFSLVEYEKAGEVRSGGAWIEEKEHKGSFIPIWKCNYPQSLSSIRDSSSSIVDIVGSLPSQRQNQIIVKPRNLQISEFHSVGVLFHKRKDGKTCVTLPVIPTGQLRKYANYMIRIGCIVECPFVFLKDIPTLNKFSDKMVDWKRDLASIDRDEHMYRRDIVSESITKFASRLREMKQKGEPFSANVQEEWERIRHDYCSALTAKCANTEYEGTDVNMSLRFNYWGPDHQKTPDMVFEFETDIVLTDIKTTEGDSTRVANNLKDKYEVLRAGVEDWTGKRTTVAVVLFDFRSKTFWVDPELRSVVDSKRLANEVKDIFKMAGEIDDSFSDRRKTVQAGTRNLKLIEKKSAFIKEVITMIFEEINISSPEVISNGVETKGCGPRVKIDQREAMVGEAFRYMRTSFRKVQKFPFNELADEMIKESQETDFSIVQTKDAIDQALISRAKDYSDDAAKFNMLPILLKETNELAPILFERQELYEISSQFTDGTKCYLPSQDDFIDEHKGRKPVDVGLHPRYEKDFDDFVEYLVESDNLQIVSRRVTELYENICYMEGRRAAASGFLTKSEAKKYGKHTKLSLRKTGLTVCKQFKGYTLCVRAGSRLTAEKQIKVKILSVENAFLDKPYLKVPRKDKWFTVSLSHIENLIRSSELVIGLEALSRDSRWVATAFSFFLFMRPVTAELLQNARYVWLSSVSYHGDKKGLVKTVIPDFWTARIDSVVVGKLSRWWKVLLSELPQQCKLKDDQELMDHMEYSHMTFPSFYNPKIRVPSERTIDEIYTCNLSSRQNGFTAHKETKMVAKLLECEIKWRKMTNHYEKREPIELYHDPGMFKYSSSAINSIFTDFFKEGYFTLEPWERMLNKFTFGLDELATMKSSVSKESTKIGENNRKRAAENFYGLYQESGLIGILSNIAAVSEWPQFVNDLFPKAQIGTREITILHYMARLQIWVVEHIMESFCYASPVEMITEKNKEEMQISIMSSFRETRLQAAREGRTVRSEVHCLDATRWSPGFNVAHFGEMVNVMPIPSGMKVYIFHTLRCIQKKRVRMPESWAKALSKRSDEDRKEFELDGSLEIREEAENNCGYILTESGMGQGILHRFSSIYHAGVSSAEEATIRVAAVKLGVEILQMHTQLSSDDKTRYILYQAQNGRSSVVFSRAAWLGSIKISPIFNIHANKKKSAGGIIAEFNSFFAVGKKPHYALIKDIYSATAVVDYTYPEKAVESKIGDIRRLVEHGLTLERLLPFVRRLRGTMIRRYTYKSSDVLTLCKMLDCSTSELPPQLGFLPDETKILAAVLYNKEMLCFQGSFTLQTFYRNFFSNTKVGKYNTNFFGGKHSISLDTAFDNRIKKLREKLSLMLGKDQANIRNFLEQTALSKMSGSTDPYKVLSALSSYPFQLMDDDPITIALPVHSLVRAAQASRKVKIDGFEGYAKGLTDSAFMILIKKSKDGKPLKSNISYFKTAVKMNSVMEDLTSKLETCRFRESHQRRKPRRYNITPGGEGTQVSVQSFIKDILCAEEPRTAIMRRIQKLTESSGTLLNTSQLEKDPMRFLYENFSGDEPLQTAEKFFEYFLGRQNFPMIRMSLTQPPKASGEENLAIILSEIYRENMIAKIGWETTDEEEACSEFLLFARAQNVPEVISTAAPRNVQKVCMWLGYLQNQSEFTYATMFFENPEYYLTLSKNAICLRSKVSPRNPEIRYWLYIKSSSTEIDPVFERLILSDMVRHPGEKMFRKLTQMTFQSDKGLIYSKSFPVIVASQTDQGTTRKLNLTIRRDKQGSGKTNPKFTVLDINDKTPFLAANLPEKLFIKKEHLLQFLQDLRLPLSSASQTVEKPRAKTDIVINSANLRNVLAQFENKFEEDEDYGIDDLMENSTDPLSLNIAKLATVVREQAMLLQQNHEEADLRQSNTVMGLKLSINNFVLKHFRENDEFRRLSEMDLYTGIVGQFGESLTNTCAIHSIFSPRISSGDEIPNSVAKHSVDSVRWYTDPEPERPLDDSILFMIEMFNEPVDIQYVHVEYPKINEMDEEGEGIIEIAEGLRSVDSVNIDFEQVNKHIEEFRKEYGDVVMIPSGSGASSFEFMEETRERREGPVNIEAPNQRGIIRDALSKSKQKISEKRRKLFGLFKKKDPSNIAAVDQEVKERKKMKIFEKTKGAWKTIKKIFK